MIDLLRPALVAALGAIGVTIARNNLTDGPLIVAVAAALAAVCLLARERGAAVAALGIGAAGAFATPDGVGPLLVATGAVLACDPSSVDRRLAARRDVLEAGVALPALAGLAATVAAQPSVRGVALGVAAAVAVVATAWRGAAVSHGGGLLLVPGVGCLAALVVSLAPDQIAALGDLPAATVQGARSVAAGLAVFALVMLAGAVQDERAAPAGARHRRAVR